MTNINIKNIAIIVDDFSIRSSYYDNVVIYDYADQWITLNEDIYLVNENPFSPGFQNNLDYGDIDNTQSYIVNSYYTNVENYYIDQYINSVTELTSLDTNIFSATYGLATYSEIDSYGSLIAHLPSDTSQPTHGDWVLEAFTTNLDYPEETFIVAVDIDFTDDIYHLFNTTQNLDGDEVSTLKYIYHLAWLDIYNNNHQDGNFYNVVGFNASFGGNSVELQSSTITEFLADDTVIVQAAPNTSQS